MPRPLIISLLTLSQQAPSSPTLSNNANNREISPAPHHTATDEGEGQCEK